MVDALTIKNEAVENKVKVLSGVDANNIPAEVLNADQPVVLKGFVSDWPAVKAAQKGKAEAIAYMRSHSQHQQVMVFKAAPEIKGRFFYNKDLSGFNFDR
jgi:hypothetical protein